MAEVAYMAKWNHGSQDGLPDISDPSFSHEMAERHGRSP